MCFKCIKNIQPSSLALNKIRVDTMAFDQISFTALNFFNFPFFVAEIWLHLHERLPPQCHVVVTGHMAYQNCQSVLSVVNETFLKGVM